MRIKSRLRNRLLLRGGGVLLLLSVMAPPGLPQPKPEQATDFASPAQQLERGKYLVHHVAMCILCHTPRTATGELEHQKLLQGAPIPMSSPFATQQWAFRAPALAGLPGGWTKAELIEFLHTGRPSHSGPVQPPMPPFRLTEQDAAAVAEYLASLD